MTNMTIYTHKVRNVPCVCYSHFDRWTLSIAKMKAPHIVLSGDWDQRQHMQDADHGKVPLETKPIVAQKWEAHIPIFRKIACQ